MSAPNPPGEFWKNKLLAYLHDPPEKACDYGPAHKERAKHYASNFGLDMAAWLDKHADWSAAAADRFIFPDGSKPGVGGLGDKVTFRHPLVGGDPVFSQEDYPGLDTAKDLIGGVLPAFKGLQPDLLFWLLWRLWKQRVAEQAGMLAYLPADTRIPDASIWHHCAIVSALEAARNNGQNPALLLFQIGPVQDFIAQARSTRDLWSGSYLLSWMIAAALKKLSEQIGPDCVIYPSLHGQPLFDWINQDKLKQAKFTNKEKESASFWNSHKLEGNQDLTLTPNLPNRFLAIVPSNFQPSRLADIFKYGENTAPEAEKSEWRKIADACWTFTNGICRLCPSGQENVKTRLWEFQCKNFWQVTWQIWPWSEVDKCMDIFSTIPTGKESPLFLGKKVAENIPDKHQDMRCFREGKLDSGWAWSAHYQILSHRVDARRQTRDFAAWQGEAGAQRDSLSGKEEALADDDWLANAKSTSLKHLIRKGDRLGSVNLIKRVWHQAYLDKKQGLKRAKTAFDSVPAVAAASWIARLLERLRYESVWLDFTSLTQTLAGAREDLPEIFIPEAITPGTRMDESHWLDSIDAEVFQQSFWDGLSPESKASESVVVAQQAMASFKRNHKLGEPSKHYAVLALDGDQIGKWLSGEKTPPIQNVITEKAAHYFHEHVKGVDVATWLKSHRPLSPSYHLQFSEALANFGLYCARRIVEAHHGQLIYSGGDDVLAMLPADEAIACGQGLRLAFQGKSKELLAHADGRCAHMFDADVPEGFIKLKDGDWNLGCRRPAEPSWPLLVPGLKATVSVGIAIGHIKEPLQDMVREAQQAEKRAKRSTNHDGWDRNAIAVTLFKRSGETIMWGAKFDSKAFVLLELFRTQYRPPLADPDAERPISGKFPYRIAEMLAKFDGSTPVNHCVGDKTIAEMAEAEINWVISQQTRKAGTIADDDLLKELRHGLRDRCKDYLCELRDNSRPLSEFYHLFALEAFIARTGE